MVAYRTFCKGKLCTVTNGHPETLRIILQSGAKHIGTPLARSPGAASLEATMLSELERGLEDDSDRPASIVLEYECSDMNSERIIQL
jgi:hypothetical protein